MDRRLLYCLFGYKYTLFSGNAFLQALTREPLLSIPINFLSRYPYFANDFLRSDFANDKFIILITK